MPQPDEVGEAEVVWLDRQAIGRQDFKHLCAVDHLRTGRGGRDRQGGKRMDRAPGGQVDPVNSQLKVADPVRRLIPRQHKEIGPGTAEKLIRPRPVNKDISAVAALDLLIAVAAKNQVACYGPDDRGAVRSAGDGWCQRAGVDGQAGDAGPLSGDEKVDGAAADPRRHRSDVVQRKPRHLQLLTRCQKPPVRHQRHQRQAAIAAAHDHEDTIA